jgi:hypothetical protein
MMLRHDSATEASFFIAADTLLRLQPGADYDVVSLLRAFICKSGADLPDSTSAAAWALMM